MFALFPRLKERRRQLAGTLSGGEQQMLAMGRALMGHPRLLMLDEPSLGLAPRIAADIFRTVAELRQSGVSILLVEQNARAALQVADRAYVMELGEFILSGTASRGCRRSEGGGELLGDLRRVLYWTLILRRPRSGRLEGCGPYIAATSRPRPSRRDAFATLLRVRSNVT